MAYLKGDWTRQDPAITAFLRQNGRDGVPLYVFFPARGGEPEVLPQILTEGEVAVTCWEHRRSAVNRLFISPCHTRRGLILSARFIWLPLSLPTMSLG